MTASSSSVDLAYLISRPARPHWIDDAIPDSINQGLLALAPKLVWTYGWSTLENKSARYWHHEVGFGAKDNTKCVRDNVSRHPARVLHSYVDWLQERVIGPSALLRYYLNAHTYGVDGAPHTDTDRSGEVTVVTYLTSTWDPRWAGSTCIYDDKGDIKHAVLPRSNRLLIFPSELLHGPEPLSRFFGGLRIVLVAKYKLL
jgi:SM-20-related protein